MQRLHIDCQGSGLQFPETASKEAHEAASHSWEPDCNAKYRARIPGYPINSGSFNGVGADGIGVGVKFPISPVNSTCLLFS